MRMLDSLRIFGRGAAKRDRRDSLFPQIEGVGYLEVLQDIVSSRDAKWYLEIGSRSGSSLSKINCNFIAIDPEFKISNPVFRDAREMFFFQMTSDNFFSSNFLARSSISPDVAFIDGMHHFEFALRDFINCERSMKKDGVILLHDVCPTSFEMAKREPTELNAGRPWTGDVWKVVVALLEYRPDLKIDVLDSRKTGLCVISKLDGKSRILSDKYDEIVSRYIDLELEVMGPNLLYQNFNISSSSGFAETLRRR